MSKEEDVETGMEAARRFAEETLSGDLRDALLTHLRQLPKVWAKLSEREQSDIIYSVERLAEDYIRQAVAIIARRGFDVVPVVVKDIAIKGGELKGKFTAHAREDTILPLADHQEKGAVMVLTDVSDFIGERAPAKADPDQRSILDAAA